MAHRIRSLSTLFLFLQKKPFLAKRCKVLFYLKCRGHITCVMTTTLLELKRQAIASNSRLLGDGETEAETTELTNR